MPRMFTNPQMPIARDFSEITTGKSMSRNRANRSNFTHTVLHWAFLSHELSTDHDQIAPLAPLLVSSREHDGGVQHEEQY